MSLEHLTTCLRRDRQIGCLNQSIAERDGQIGSLNQVIAKRDGQISNLAHQVQSLINSTSWRLTKPVRLSLTNGEAEAA